MTAAPSAYFRLRSVRSSGTAHPWTLKGGGGVDDVDDEDLEIIVERAAGLDVHKDMVAACVRVPGEGGRVLKHVAEFATFTEDLLALRDWLVAQGVTRVGMEATGVYWKPAFYALEDAMECW